MRLIKIQYAIKKGVRILATPKDKAICKLCKQEVISKCGEINIWHWAHKNLDCDTWAEPETEWHINWKNRFPKNTQEVIMGDHRADVHYKGKTIEFQNSPIDNESVFEREEHYNFKLLWVLNAEKFPNTIHFKNKKNYYTFRWYHPRKSWWYTLCPIILDLGGGRLFWIKKLYEELPCRGWGTSHSYKILNQWLGI